MKVQMPEFVYKDAIQRILTELQGSTQGVSFAVTSLRPGAGVSYTTRNLRLGLQAAADLTVEVIESGELRRISRATVLEEPLMSELSIDAVQSSIDRRRSSMMDLRATIDEYSRQTDVLLVDCPAIEKSGEAVYLGPNLTGILLVIEAGEVTKTELVHAERRIATAGGRTIGVIFNRTNSPLRSWFGKFAKRK